MTQPSDDAALVTRLRALTGTVHSGAAAALTEAATALEAKDRRIAEAVREADALRIALWNHLSKQGVKQDDALEIIRLCKSRAALEPSDKGVR